MMLLPTQDEEARLMLMNTEFKDADADKSDIGTWYLQDSGVAKIFEAMEQLGYHKGLPTSIEEALNSGDGVYRP